MSQLQQLFQQLVDGHYREVWSYAALLTRGSQAAEDITHQAFLLAFDRLAAGERAIDEPGKWLRGTVRNLVRAWWREQKRLPQDLADHLCGLAEEADDAPTAALRAERMAALAQCLEHLSHDERRLVSARYEGGLRVAQIAQIENVNEATARVKLFRIRQSLKACMEGKFAGGFA